MAFPQAGVLITADVSRYAKAMQQMESVTSSTLGRVNGALGAFGVALSAASAFAFTKQVIDAADALNDLEKRTGISVERLSAWRLATEQSGTSMDALAGALGKAGKYMVEHGDNLKALGINGRTAEEVMINLAGVISSLPSDDPRRVALAMEVLGKSAGDLLPLLSEGEAGLRGMLAQGEALSPVTAEMAQRSDAFNDSLAAMKAQMFSGAAVLVDSMLPAMQKFLDLMFRLSGNEAPGKAATRLFDELASAQAALKSKLDQRENGLFGMFITDADIARQQRYVDSIKGQLNAAIAETDAARAKAAKDEEARNLKAVSLDERRLQIDKLLQTSKKEGGKAATDFAKLEADHLRKLMEQEEQLIARRKESQAQALDAMAREVAGWNDLTEAQRVSWEIEAGRYKDFDASTQQELVRLAELLDARNALADAQKRFAADEAEQQRIFESVMDDATDQTLEEMRKQKQAHDDLWASIDRTAHDTFVSIFDSGKSAFSRLKDMIKNTFFDWLYSMTVKKWIFNIGASVTGAGASGAALASGESGGMPGMGSGGILGNVWDVVTKGFDSANAGLLGGIADFGASVADLGGVFGDVGGWIGANNALLGNVLPFAGAAFSLLKGDMKGAIGSAIGAALTFTPLGPVGGLIGSALGGMLGGMFGGHIKRPKEWANTMVSQSGGQTVATWQSDGGAQGQAKASGLYMADAIKNIAAIFGKEITKSFMFGSYYQQKYDAYTFTVGSGATKNEGDFTARAGQTDDAAAMSFLIAAKRGYIQLEDYLTNIIDIVNHGTAKIQSANGRADELKLLVEIKNFHDGLALLPPVFKHVQNIMEQMTSMGQFESMKALSTATQNYYSLFTSDAQKTADNADFVTQQMALLGKALPETRDGFKALVEGIDTTTASGAGLFGALVNLASPMDAYYKALEEQASITDAAANSMRNMNRYATRESYQRAQAYLRTGLSAGEIGGAYANIVRNEVAAGGQPGTAMMAQLTQVMTELRNLQISVARNTKDTSDILIAAVRGQVQLQVQTA